MFLMELYSSFILASMYMKVQNDRSNLVVNALVLTFTLYFLNSFTQFISGTFQNPALSVIQCLYALTLASSPDGTAEEKMVDN